jgi:SAM-dependent methyltransferase
MDYEKFYNEQPDYEAFRNDKEKQEEYKIAVDWKVRNLCHLVPKELAVKNILEIGCAFGVLLNNLSDRLQIQSRTGIDISGKNIEIAKNLYPGCNFFQGTIEDFIKIKPLGIGNHRFDIAVLSDIVEHIPDDLGFLELVRKISSHVILNLPLEKSFTTRNRNYGEEDPSGHLRCYDKIAADKLVMSAGFEVVTSFTSIAFFDKGSYKIYKKSRSRRVRSKPLPKRLYWSLYYFAEDRVKLISKKFYEKMYGTNYFALLRSIN